MPTIIPIRDMKDTAALSQMCSESSEPIFITKNGYGNMVVMSMETYEKKMWLLDVYAGLARSEEELQRGETADAHDTLTKLREKYGL